MAKTERSGHTTTDHDFIRQWVEERGGWPARVVGTGGDEDPGLIRIDFPGFSGEGSLEQIEWEQWFEGFEANQLAFLHRDIDHGGGDLDRFNKLISRTGEEDGEGSEGAGGQSGASSARSRASSGGGGSARKSSGSRGGSSADTGAEGGGKAASGRGGSAGRQAESAGGKRGAASETAETGASGRGAKGAGGASKGKAGSGDEGGVGGELRGLLLHDLGDLLSAERLFLASTKVLAREAQDPEVRTRVEEHVSETEGQIERLKEAFGVLGERARAVTCEAARGLKEEHDSFKSEEKPSKLLLSAFGLGSGLRVEHYEIAAYRSAIELATALGERECAQILNESLKEELAMASFLEKNSRAVLKRMVAGEEGGGGGGGAAKASSRGGSSSARKSGGAEGATAESGSSGKSSGRGGSSSGAKSGGGSSGRGGSSSGGKSGGASSSRGKSGGGSGGGRSRA